MLICLMIIRIMIMVWVYILWTTVGGVNTPLFLYSIGFYKEISDIC